LRGEESDLQNHRDVDTTGDRWL